MPRIALHTLGCKLNFAETGTLAREFEEHGHTIVPFGTAADVAILNTCAVTDEAERKCRQTIRRLLAAHPATVVAVTGCYAQLRPEEIAAIEGVDLVVGTREKADLVHRIEGLVKGGRTQIDVSCIDGAGFSPAFARGSRTRGFLKIQDGCDYSCAFCTIPQARGRARSSTVRAAVDEARRLADDGAREIVLSGVNIGLFGTDTGESLPALLRDLDAVDSIARFRISSIEPNLLTDELIDFVAASRAFQPHFHIPLQSGDDTVLGAMRRRYRRQVFAERVARIEGAMGHAAIGADVIVGFPGETGEQFENTVRFIEDLPLSYLHVFSYSERPGTASASLDAPAVNPAERSRRNRALTLLSARLHRQFAQRNAGTCRNVLWEAPTGGLITGFTDNYLRVRSSSDAFKRGDISAVTLDRPGPDGSFETDPRALSVLG